MIPHVYIFILLCLIAYRVWRLIAEDDILEPPRRKLVRLTKDWEPGDTVPKAYRGRLAEFITCPWCAGAWVSLLVYGFWLFTLGDGPHSFEDVLLGIGVWFAISCSVGLIRSKLDPPE